MQLPLQDFAALVRSQAAAVVGSSRQLIDMSVGSVLRAVLEANASVGLWIQWLILQVLATTRAATSTGADLDSWVADFGLVRLPGVPAYGVVTFGRLTPGLPAVVPVGTVVRTGAGGLSFQVIGDGGHPAWIGGAYRLGAAASGFDLPVVALAPGIGGNVRAGEIGLLGRALPGIDQVSNAAPLQGGYDAEADEALRVRFGGFIDSRTRATPQAVVWAVMGLRQGLSVALAERVDSAGAVRPGHFMVTVDDGTGTAPASLLADAGRAIDAVRPVGSTFGVRGPLVVRANILMRVVGPVAPVAAAVGRYVAGLPIGAPLVLSRLTQVAHDADTRVQSVYGITINGVGSDLNVPAHGLVRAGSIEVTP